MDEGEMNMKTKIGNLHEEFIIKDEPINQLSVLPSTENSNIPQKKVQIKAKVEKSDLRVRKWQKWACSVPQCSNKLTNRIFGYPSNAKQKERWLQALKVDKCKPSDKVCYLHFKEKDFGKRNLNYGVVPSQNLPQELKGETKLVPIENTENEPDNSKAIESNEIYVEENNSLRARLSLPAIHSNSLAAGKQNLKKYYEIPHKEVHIKKESIDQGFILSSTENTNFMNPSIGLTTKQEIPETYDKSKTFSNKLEKIEELGIFVKSETDIKPEIIFGISESDSECVMSTVNSDPLDITDHEDNFSKKDSIDKNCHEILDLKKPFSTVHEEIINQPNSLEKCKFCPEFVKNTYMDEHIALLHTIKCHFCPKHFAKGAEMNAHVSSVHAFKCQFCPAKFIISS